MKKIGINENDIKQMVIECVTKILSENTRYGHIFGEDEWVPFDDETITSKIPQEKLQELVEQGFIPDDLDAFFTITLSINGTYDEGNGYDIAPSNDYSGERVYGGDYGKVNNLISQIKQKELQILFQDAFNKFCGEINADPGDFIENDPDDYR